MLLFKLTLVALALAKNRRLLDDGEKRPGGGGGNSACRGLEEADMQGFMDKMLDAFDSTTSDFTVYCQIDADFEAFPGCPDVARRNLQEERKKRYNKARMSISDGTTSHVQVRFRNEDSEDTYPCYTGTELQFTVNDIDKDWEVTTLGTDRKAKVTAGLTMTQTFSETGCTITHELTCKIPRRGGLYAVDETTCDVQQMDCYTTDKESTTGIGMRCYTDATKIRGFSSADDCPSSDDGTDDGTDSGTDDGTDSGADDGTDSGAVTLGNEAVSP